MHTRIVLRGSLTHSEDSVQPGWGSQEWRLATARSSAGEPVSVDLIDDEVIELELDDGSSLFLLADQLESYGFRPSRSAGGGIEIGVFLQPPDAGSSRDGLGRWALRALRLWKNPVGAGVFAAAGAAEDARLGQRRGWYRFEAGAEPAKRLDTLPAATEPVLLLIHGTFSSCPGSFSGMFGGDAWQRLRGRYGPRIYGFEHRTLTESPLDNALALLEALPDDQIVDLVTHSRGGLVAELLIRGSDRSGGRFSAAHIEAFRRSLDPAVADEVAAKLERLQAGLERKHLTIRRIVRAAAPMRGTTVLSGRLDRWASIGLSLVKQGLEYAARPDLAEIVATTRALMLELTRQRAEPTVLPGLESMRPESPWVALLNPPSDVRVTTPTFVIAGDYRGKGFLTWLADRISDTFYGGANDWVVNTSSMTGGATREGGIRRALYRDSSTIHTTYFDRDIVRPRILDALERGTEAEGFELLARETSTIARGGRKIKEKPGAPIALLLPGITGSHLQVGKDRIWLQFHELIFGNLAKLAIGATNVTPDGWIDSAYEDLAEFLARTHEVRPYSYDWRLSIADTGASFARVLATALDDARQRNQPVHIFAHSMGGLVARFALGLDGLWDRLQDRLGSRLVQLGTPNQGSHSIPWLLMGREKTLRMLARVDRRHDPRELVDLFRKYPGMLQLMPYGTWPDRSYFDPVFWKTVRAALGDAWPVPDSGLLDDCALVLRQLDQSPLANRPVVYVAGYNRDDGTIAGFDHTSGDFRPQPILQGDGRVLWSSGIPSGVPAYFVNAVHGDLACHRRSFEAYLELATRGETTRLPTSPPVALDGRDPVGRGRGVGLPDESALLYPTKGELVAAALGGRPPREASAVEDLAPPLEIRLVHGTFVTARGPILVGRYENDVELRGSLQFLDGLLGGALGDALALDCLPAALGDVHVTPPAPGSSLRALVVGLGRLGDLTPGGLREALGRGLLQLVLAHPSQDERDLAVSAILVGSGDFGLAIDSALFALIQAALKVQRSVAARARLSTRSLPRLASLTIYERDELRAERIAAALIRFGKDQALGFHFDRSIASGEGGLRRYLQDGSGSASAQRVVIRAPRGIEGGFELTAISKSARSDFNAEPGQGQFVTRMLSLATNSTLDEPGLSRALYELITPNAYKPVLANLDGLVLNVDEPAAAIPWELMRDPHESGAPLATRISMIRQLVRSPQQSAPRASVRRALVIGDTAAGPPYQRLDGARAEMRAVQARLASGGFDVDTHEGIAALDLLTALLTEDYGILHIAAHGDWVRIHEDGSVISSSSPRALRSATKQLANDGASGTLASGVVLGDGLLMTSRQIAKLPRVPELVFLNCCHLGDTTGDSPAPAAPWPELAASLAVAFIDRGAKVVVAAGWAVDDAAALTFADKFYLCLTNGEELGPAVREARKATWGNHPLRNTWGAYQAYGDDRYRLEREGPRSPKPPITTRLAALDALHELVSEVQYHHRLTTTFPGIVLTEPDLEGLVGRLSPGMLADAEVRAAVAQAFQAARKRAQAIVHYEAAVGLEQASLAVRNIEQLANLETREATSRAEGLWSSWSAASVPEDAARQLSGWRELLDRGRRRLEQLDGAIPATTERLCLLGSAWKRTAWFDSILAVADDTEARDPLKALSKSIKAYGRAVDSSARQTGQIHHYPANNLAQLLWLEGIVSQPRAGAAEKIDGLARAALSDAARRAESGGDFWDHAAGVDGALSLVLAEEAMAANGGPQAGALATRLIDAVDNARGEVRRRFGNDYRNASPDEQLQFGLAMLRWCHHTAGDASRADRATGYAAAFASLRRALSEPLASDPLRSGRQS